MATGRDVFGSRAFAVGVAQSVVCVALGAVAMTVVSDFEKIFADFGTTLPTMTIIVISFTRFLIHYRYVALLPALVWPFVNWGIVSLLSPRPEVVIPRWLWYTATWLVILLVVALAVVALVLPLIGPISLRTPTPVAPMNLGPLVPK